MTCTAEPVIVVTRRWPDAVEAELRRRYRRVVLNDDDVALGPAGLRDALASADVVLPTVSDRLSADLFQGELRTRFLGNFGAGHEHIDVKAATEAGIVVTNTPGVLTDATADLAMTLLLMAARRAGEGERQVRAGTWGGWRPTHLLGQQVTGQLLGIVGMGRIGAALARRAHLGFGMEIIYFHSPRSQPQATVPAARRVGDLDELFALSDVVSLHVPGGPANRHLVDAARLRHMKRTAVLVNCARGEVVDSDALADALRAGTIAAAGLDVYEGEPEVPRALLDCENAVLLPHLGSATRQTRIAMGLLVIENLDAYLAGRRPPNLVPDGY